MPKVVAQSSKAILCGWMLYIYVCMHFLACCTQREVRDNFSYFRLLLFTLLVLRKGLLLNLELVSRVVSSRRQGQQAAGIHRSTLSTVKLHTYTDAGACPTEPSHQPSKATLLTSVQPYCPPLCCFLAAIPLLASVSC